jgi:hypothetical protein
MASVRRRKGRVDVDLDERERRILVHIVDELAEELGSAARTSPRAYDDPQMEQEYARYVRPEVETTRRADIDALRSSIESAQGTLRLDEETALGWLRALNHLRLVAAARVGIEQDGWEESLDGEAAESDDYAVLVTLGWLQDSIIAALED